MASPYLFCSCPGNRAIVAQPQASNKDILFQLYLYKNKKLNKSIERKRYEIYESFRSLDLLSEIRNGK